MIELKNKIQKSGIEELEIGGAYEKAIRRKDKRRI